MDISSMKEAIASGRVYHQKNFLNQEQLQHLLSEMGQLESNNCFQRSGLSKTNKGKNQGFGNQDRSTCETPWWKDSILVNSDANSCAAKDDDVLQSIIDKIHNLRNFLSTNLDRPTLIEPTLAHECYYSKSTEGSILPRHMDERHEETKGARGWLLPSRRSISWLIYLSDKNWDLEANGGALRAFPQKGFSSKGENLRSGCHDGNLQVGWLSSTSSPDVIPVFLDSWFKYTNQQTGEVEPHCVLYIPKTSNPLQEKKPNDRIILTQPFLSDAIIGQTVADFVNDRAILEKQNKMQGGFFLREEYAKGFYLIEDRQLWSLDKDNHPPNSYVQDVSPELGTLVLFDSVSVPHEVTLVKNGNRAALAGWFHEETQPFPEDFYT